MPLLSVVAALIVVALVAWLSRARVPMPENMRPIFNVVLWLMVVGIILWLINTYVPMAGSIKAILNIVVVVATCVGVLQAVGLWSQIVKAWHNLTTNRRIIE